MRTIAGVSFVGGRPPRGVTLHCVACDYHATGKQFGRLNDLAQHVHRTHDRTLWEAYVLLHDQRPVVEERARK